MLTSFLSLFLCAFLLACSLCVSVRAAVAADEVTSLPGWSGALPSKHYSGYFPTTINGTSAGMLHYWLTLSERSPSTDPLVLWLQGGPGCSSLFGMLYENGQLHFSGDKDAQGVPLLVQNPSAWTKVANMLWLEQPVGVGFSYCVAGAKGDCSGNDFGEDAYHFFLNFFKAYPELAKAPFHITGESYAGVYVPYVADAILTGNQGGQNPQINLVGLAIGNGVGGDDDASESLRRELDFFYGKADIPYAAMQHFWTECGTTGNLSDACVQLVYKMEQGVGPWYVYDVYDTCPHDLEAVPLSSLTQAQAASMGAPLFAPVRPHLQDLGFVCVLESVSSDYLNTKDVQAAIHTTPANVTGWGPCGNSDKTGRHALSAHRRAMEKAGLMGPNDRLGDLYKKLIPEIPILIYSGDVDMCVPYFYSDNWLRRLGYSVTSEWVPWMYMNGPNNNQLGGYVTHFDTKNLTFLTVRDSGHMVPQYQPEAALVMFTRYLAGTPF